MSARPSAGERAARAGRADEAVDLAARSVPDLDAGRRLVEVAIGRVVELIGEPCAAGFARVHFVGDASRHVRIVLRIGVRHRGNEAHVGAGHAQRVDLLPALRLGHRDDRAIAAARAEQREADAGVASRALDDHAAGQQVFLEFRVEQEAECGTILDRATRVGELGLRENLAAGELGGGAQPDQGRVADRVGEVVADVHGESAGLPGQAAMR